LAPAAGRLAAGTIRALPSAGWNGNRRDACGEAMLVEMLGEVGFVLATVGLVALILSRSARARRSPRRYGDGGTTIDVTDDPELRRIEILVGEHNLDAVRQALAPLGPARTLHGDAGGRALSLGQEPSDAVGSCPIGEPRATVELVVSPDRVDDVLRLLCDRLAGRSDPAMVAVVSRIEHVIHFRTKVVPALFSD
jgi:nitrogen regulatory protein PII